MKLSHFFIERPIFASVVSIVIVILGAVAYLRLPVAQYPEIAPPVINVSGQFPGASAETVAETVVAPIEQQINGVEGMLYISSNSTADGRFSIQVTFNIGTNLDIAQVQVQNRVAQALPRLPEAARALGEEAAVGQRADDEALEIARGLRLHACGDFFGEELEEELGHGSSAPSRSGPRPPSCLAGLRSRLRRRLSRVRAPGRYRLGARSR